MFEKWENYKNEPTERLIDLITKKDTAEGAEVAKDAFRSLCFRFQSEIISNIRVVVYKWGYDIDTADEIAYNALDRFWKYPKFKAEKCSTTNIDKCFIFYIHKICRRLLINHKNNIDSISDTEGSEEIIYEFPNMDRLSGKEGKSELIELSKKIDTALSQLGPKHKAIYLTYKAYEQAGKKLPRPLLDKIRIALNITQNTVRFYKKEANEIVQKIMDEHGK